MNQFILEGAFVQLEKLNLDHLNDLARDFDPTLFNYYPKPYTSAHEFVEENLEMAKQESYVPFAIIHKQTGEAIGCTEFSDIDEKNRKLEIGGSWLKPNFHGTAANSESKLLLLQHAFETLGCVRVQFRTNVVNVRSRMGIEKIGGRFEGILRHAMILPDGTLRDDVYYSIIKSEWFSTKAALRSRIQSKIGTMEGR